MVNELQKFNATLKRYMEEAKILEKVHPSKSVPLWTQICEYIVIFAKSKNCPWQLRNKLVIQADQILQRVKSMQRDIEVGGLSEIKSPSEQISGISPFPNANNSPQSPFLVSGPPPFGENSHKKEITEADFAALPDVSLDLPDVPTTDPTSSTNIPPSNKNPFVPSGPPPISPTENSNPADVIKNLARIEDELKKMPSGLKDLHSASPLGPQFKDETITLDITTAPVGSPGSGDIPTFIPSETPTGSLPFHVKGLKDDNDATHVPVKDPFGPVDFSNQPGIKGQETTCFACGSSVAKTDKICPQCGTPLQ